MSGGQDGVREAQWLKWRSVAELYHAYFTGLILSVVTRRGTADAAEFVFRVFRRQQQERFLPGLEKLGLSHLPPAVSAAQYHYLSNWIGGVSVEYMHETDRKAWIRYPPPRWIWKGTAICGVPGEVSRAMLRGWHAHNGVSLGNPKLGFVCTKQSVDGQDGLEGYYCEYDHALEIDQRLMFARHLEAPLFDPATAPALPVASWPKQRLGARIRLFRRDEECAPDLGPADARQVSAEPRRPGPRHKNVRHGARRRHAAARDRLPQIAVSTIRCEPVTRADEEHPMINLRVNGTTRAVDADPAMPLLWALRDLLGMTSTKYGCGIGACGACTVHLNGQAVRSCITAIGDVGDQQVTTIEGLSPEGTHPLQRAWIANNVPQCGY